MKAEQTPTKQVTPEEQVETSEQKPVISTLLKKGSQEWRAYVAHDRVAECRFRLSLIEEQVSTSSQEQSEQITQSNSDTIIL